MPLDERHWRPITYQGITFPATLMGISVLEPILGIMDEEVAHWLLRLSSCCGVKKSAPAEQCARCAQGTIDSMLEQRQQVLNGIRDRLGPYGFDPEATYRDWLSALQRIVELSTAASDNCSWSAPPHPDDGVKTAADIEKFMRNNFGK